jgi:nucleoside-diphosphate-sugar epimerase
MNVVLTGHEGLIGSALKKRLEKEGHRVVLGIDKRSGKDLDFLENYKPGPFDKVDLVIHAAAFCKINKIVKDPNLGHTNVLNDFRVLEFCRKNNVPKVMYFSTSRTLSKEKNAYTAGKIYGEELCKAYKECYGINYIIIRPSTVYGPFLDKTKRLIHLFITAALANRDLMIYGDPGTKTLDFTHIDDFIDGVMLTINKNGWNREYDISGGEEFNIHDLAKFIIQETGSQSQIKVSESELAQPQKVKLDISEIQKLGYSQKIPLLDGVKKTIEWYANYSKENPGVFDSF